MKKVIIVLAIAFISLLGSNKLQAQNFAIGGETGFNLFVPNNSNFAIPIGANIEWDINGKLSLQARLSFDIGIRGGDFNIFYINPEIRYHFSEVFDGAYIGGYFGFGPVVGNSLYFSGSTFYLSIGAVGGYEIMLTDKLNLDISAQLGYGAQTNSFVSFNGLHFRPTVGLRYLL